MQLTADSLTATGNKHDNNSTETCVNGLFHFAPSTPARDKRKAEIPYTERVKSTAIERDDEAIHSKKFENVCSNQVSPEEKQCARVEEDKDVISTKTPQQISNKRKKYMPKVVIEGKIKRNSSQMRKKVTPEIKRKCDRDTDENPLDVGCNLSTKKSCRALNFDDKEEKNLINSGIEKTKVAEVALEQFPSNYLPVSNPPLLKESSSILVEEGKTTNNEATSKEIQKCESRSDEGVNDQVHLNENRTQCSIKVQFKFLPFVYKRKKMDKKQSGSLRKSPILSKAETQEGKEQEKCLFQSQTCLDSLIAENYGKFKRKKRTKMLTRTSVSMEHISVIWNANDAHGHMINSSEKNKSSHSIQEQEKCLFQSQTCLDALTAEDYGKIKRKKRSKMLTRIRVIHKEGLHFHMNIIPIVLEEIIQKLKNLDFTEQNEERKDLVPYEFEGKIVPYVFTKKPKIRAKVDLDDMIHRVPKFLIGKEASDDVETNVEKERWWEKERLTFKGRVDSFIARMHCVQGNRRFSPWKGSVVDSVVGVFLTQNVSDHLSSSSFMSLASQYPVTLHYCRDGGSSNSSRTDSPTSQADTSTAVTKLEETDKCQMLEGNALNSNSEGHNFEKHEVHTNADGFEIQQGHADKDGFDEEGRKDIEWELLRRKICNEKGGDRSINTYDSVNWEAVRCAQVNKIADAIKERGMNNVLASRIQEFLHRLDRDHGSINLEWLRDIPPDQVKDYLLSVRGLGLKSVECVRLLTLEHVAFPVDTNVARICVRLGWVPLRPLPESLQLHLLELYPIQASVQKYLWPRLCKLDQRTLYELHYQMITFGKVFCTKSKPNCNACPMRGECKHFASAFSSARLALPTYEEKDWSISTLDENKLMINLASVPYNEVNEILTKTNVCEPIIEEPSTPEYANPESQYLLNGENEFASDIEDIFIEDSGEIPEIRLNIEALKDNIQNFLQENNKEQELYDLSKALVALTPQQASIPMPKLKNVNRLRTEHLVYELPDSHPLLQVLSVGTREPDDPCPYLLAIWTSGDMPELFQSPDIFNNDALEAKEQTVPATLLIPCRTAMRGSFPLNGTYFQVNEVFADHDSSLNPLNVPRDWIWNLPRRIVYFGTSIPTIFRGLSTEEIQQCFWRGFVCLRGFEQKTRAPRPLIARLHIPKSKEIKMKGTSNKDK